MSAEFCLHFAAACLSYFLRVAAGYFVCLMVARLFEKPSHRSLVWTAFLLGSAAFWLGFLVSNFHIFAAGTTETGKVAALSSTDRKSVV